LSDDVLDGNALALAQLRDAPKKRTDTTLIQWHDAQTTRGRRTNAIKSLEICPAVAVENRHCSIRRENFALMEAVQ